MGFWTRNRGSDRLRICNPIFQRGDEAVDLFVYMCVNDYLHFSQMDKKIPNSHKVAVHLLRAISYAHDQVRKWRERERETSEDVART